MNRPPTTGVGGTHANPDTAAMEPTSGGDATMKKALALVLFLVGLSPLSAMTDDTLVQFKGGIGVIPVSSGVGTAATAEVVNRNIVRGVQPAGQIWVIADLSAVVKVDGRIQVDGRGLLLGGGNNIGGNAGASVFATLLCGNTPHDSHPAGVPLAANGDFRIDDILSTTPPNPCGSPVLLIRNVTNLSWFAAGIPKLDHD